MRMLKKCPFCGNDVMLHRVDDFVEDFGYHIVCPCCDTSSPIYDIEQEAIEYWNHREPGWASVEDDLPAEDEMVLVYGVKNGRGSMYEDELYRGVWDCSTVNGLKVTHWMPKPEPPKSKE